MDEDEYSSFSQLAVWPKQDDAHDLLGNPERNPMKINMWNILVKVWKMIFLCKWGWFSGSILIFQAVSLEFIRLVTSSVHMFSNHSDFLHGSK